jgi:hypothetical protein
MAAAAIRGITQRVKNASGIEARLSLARTAKLVIDHASDREEEAFAPEAQFDRSPQIELTDWGKAQRILPPVQIAGVPMHWDYAASGLGSAAPKWSDE